MLVDVHIDVEACYIHVYPVLRPLLVNLLCLLQPAITSGIPLGSANSQYAVPQAYVNLAAAIVSTEGGCSLLWQLSCWSCTCGLDPFINRCQSWKYLCDLLHGAAVS